MNRKGSAVIGIIVVLAVAAVVAIGVYYLTHRGSGTGDKGLVPSVEASASIAPETEQLEYMEVTIDGNDYIYNNEKTDIEAIIAAMEEHDEIAAVRIADRNASQKAYRELTAALDEKSIKYIEGDAESEK
ncbi:MAG: hypothetical protein J6I46_15715 [Ruminococcus sp.]|nr:hypothetical protein [Ruminococcus sp.]MBP3799205.1 hypothetical protein [Ruminococcus sp.]MBQ1432908.1 hypothetical protein [Ruminococcus sp.]